MDVAALLADPVARKALEQLSRSGGVWRDGMTGDRYIRFKRDDFGAFVIDMVEGADGKLYAEGERHITPRDWLTFDYGAFQRGEGFPRD